MPIEDYALLGDTQTAALVGKDGSIDWACFPRFDSGACFAALLGTPEHGRWRIGPQGKVTKVSRRYRPGTLVLETTFETDSGSVRLVDCMPPRGSSPDLVRQVEGVRGEVAMSLDLVMRFDYGRVLPWVRSIEGDLRAIAGPDALCLRTPVKLEGKEMTTVAAFTVRAGEKVPFVLSWHPSHLPPPRPLDAAREIAQTQRWWEKWSSRCRHEGPWLEDVRSSLVVLKALSYAPTGGIVAAPTTSLPELIGGVRNWDYRYCWLRDATLTLYALLLAGYHAEAKAWRDWLLRAVAGDPAELQIMYGLAGERRLVELELPWLPGHEGSKPVRIGNAAAGQLQLDVYGEVMDALYQSARMGVPTDDGAWRMQRSLLDWLETGWKQPDEGIWEVRGGRQHFVHSKVMAWVAFDRAIKSIEEQGQEGPLDRFRRTRAEIHAEVLEKGWDEGRQTFTQSYGSRGLDASSLLIPLVGFLDRGDPRVASTVRAIERELLHDGLVHRYATHEGVDGLPAGEGAFLACSFWLADAYEVVGRKEEARALFSRLLALRNDVGLLAEEYDPRSKRQLGNFPQAFSHLSLVNTAFNLSHEPGPSDHRPAKVAAD